MAGTSFCISTASGNIVPGVIDGLFFRDTRFLSGWRLMIEGLDPEPLSVISEEPFSATFISRLPPPAGRADSTVLILRSRAVERGMSEQVVLRNLAAIPVRLRLSVLVEADFAGLFDVKDGRVAPGPPPTLSCTAASLSLASSGPGPERGLAISLPAGATCTGSTINLDVSVPGRSDWSGRFDVALLMGGRPAGAGREEPSRSESASAELRAWRAQVTVIDATDPSWDAALGQGVEDIGALRMMDPDGSGRAVVAAGAPWFMALFGRDALITAWMTLCLDPSLAHDTLKTLGRYQGTKLDTRTEEEPGRILHEMRWGLTDLGDGDGGGVYYGTVDAPPLFVMLWGEAARWGMATEEVERLLPSVDRALDWIASRADADPDGFVNYRRMSGSGLVNQGWKDSWDGINFADGRVAEPPIALCEVQGYVYAAYGARARLALRMGDTDAAGRYEERAAALKAAFNRVLWLADRGYFAVGLDHERVPIDALTSNLGHCLWTGVVDDDKAASVVGHLMSPELFTGWGLRTLSNRMGAYNPVSYHNGSVWPHDTALAVAGLMRYGYRAEAGRLGRALLDAADAFRGRLPELFCGFSRREFPVPVSYPASCSPQAWASAVPFSLVTSLLDLRPDSETGRLEVRPGLPDQLGTVRLEGGAVGSQRLVVGSAAHREGRHGGSDRRRAR